MELLSGAEARWLPDGGCEILHEVAESMLLCREDDPEVVVELRRDAAATVGELTDAGLLSPDDGPRAHRPPARDGTAAAAGGAGRMSVATTAGSIWIETGERVPELPRLEGDVDADIAVIGGGIVGVTTALIAAEAGARVVLVDAGRIGHGVTGHTTAKITSQHGLVYARLRSRFGAEAARTYAQANEAALEWIAERVERHAIDCDFRRRAAYAYLEPGSARSKLEDELRAAREAGLHAELVERIDLPYPVEAALRFSNQAEFHPHRYLLGLLARLDELGARVFEHTLAAQVDAHEGCVVRTPGGSIRAGRAVVATHYPFLDRSLAFARVHTERSYAIACRIEGAPPEGMFISAESPTRSIRSVPVAGEELLLVGGEGHRTGQGGDTASRYETLERFAREHWDVRSVDYRWSSQDGITLDGVPYVGRVTPRNERLLMATGFAKWGMTGGTAAAIALANLLEGRRTDAARLFDPVRLKPLTAGPKLLEENARIGLRFAWDRISKRGGRPLTELAPGEGDIVEHDGEPVAGHRYDDGRLVAVSAVCTHLGCRVNWNSAERSWDCPCHGSRFDPEGNVLEGPAVRRLERKPV